MPQQRAIAEGQATKGISPTAQTGQAMREASQRSPGSRQKGLRSPKPVFQFMPTVCRGQDVRFVHYNSLLTNVRHDGGRAT
jgi:hypothetical protein